MSTRVGAPIAGNQAKVILEYMAPGMILRPVVLRNFVWYFLTMASILFLSTAAAVAAITTG
jgi:hypothetical protein